MPPRKRKVAEPEIELVVTPAPEVVVDEPVVEASAGSLEADLPAVDDLVVKSLEPDLPEAADPVRVVEVNPLAVPPSPNVMVMGVPGWMAGAVSMPAQWQLEPDAKLTHEFL